MERGLRTRERCACALQDARELCNNRGGIRPALGCGLRPDRRAVLQGEFFNSPLNPADSIGKPERDRT